MATLIAETPRVASEVEVSPDEEARLLKLAQTAVAAAARGDLDQARRAASRATLGAPPDGSRRGAAFVTLLERGELRGCIGVLDAARPLAESVAEAAIGAVLHDWRFRPVTEDELRDVEVGISVLGPLVELDDPRTFRLGIDGLVVVRDFDRGLLLPEVATEHELGTIAMLRAVCGKAGLPADAWRDPRTRVFAFRTRRFGGPAIA